MECAEQRVQPVRRGQFRQGRIRRRLWWAKHWRITALIQTRLPTCRVSASECMIQSSVRLLRYTTTQFLVVVIVFIVSVPLLEDLKHAKLIGSALFTAMLLSAIPAVGGQRKTLIVATVLVTA